jgi:hypothetical protein
VIPLRTMMKMGMKHRKITMKLLKSNFKKSSKMNRVVRGGNSRRRRNVKRLNNLISCSNNHQIKDTQFRYCKLIDSWLQCCITFSIVLWVQSAVMGCQHGCYATLPRYNFSFCHLRHASMESKRQFEQDYRPVGVRRKTAM